MSRREKIKQQIDTLNEQELAKVSEIITSLIGKKRTDGLPTFDLNGKFDKMDVRKEAYE